MHLPLNLKSFNNLMVKKNAAVAGERKTPCVKPQSYNTRWTLGKANNKRKLKVVNQSSNGKRKA